jgi:hypothetical protein
MTGSQGFCFMQIGVWTKQLYVPTSFIYLFIYVECYNKDSQVAHGWVCFVVYVVFSFVLGCEDYIIHRLV